MTNTCHGHYIKLGHVVSRLVFLRNAFMYICDKHTNCKSHWQTSYYCNCTPVRLNTSLHETQNTRPHVQSRHGNFGVNSATTKQVQICNLTWHIKCYKFRMKSQSFASLNATQGTVTRQVSHIWRATTVRVWNNTVRWELWELESLLDVWNWWRQREHVPHLMQSVPRRLSCQLMLHKQHDNSHVKVTP
jgi:hypothetical protein